MNNLDNSPTVSRSLIYAFFLLWTLPLLVGGYEQQSLMPHDEGLYATRARLMWETGDWVNPWLKPHYKTPGIYWLLAIIYRFFGMSETTVRLPSVIFSLIAVVLVYEIGRIVINHYAGFLAAIILNLQFLWLQYSRLANPDLPTIVLILLSIFCLLKGENSLFKYRNILLGVAGLCWGLALVFRGFMVAIPLLSLSPYLILENRRHHHLNNIWLYVGFILGTIPLLIWLYLSWSRFGLATFQSLFGLVVTLGNDNRHDHSSFFYVLSLASSAFPWALLSVVGLIIIWRNKFKFYKTLILGFPTIYFILISLYSTRLHHYSLGIYPFTALLSGGVLYCLWKPKQKQFIVNKRLYPTLNYIFTGSGIIFLAAAIIVFLYFKSEIQYAKIALVTSVPWIFLSLIYYQKYSRWVWLSVLLLGNWLGLLTAVNIGAIGNYSPEIKTFIQQSEVAKIINNNTIYLLEGGGETRTLFKFYLPHVQTNTIKYPPPPCSYGMSEAKFIDSYGVSYKSLANFRDWELIQKTDCIDSNSQN
ncbi:MAG: hypothetical protein Tsb0014_41720 [Pleurocapsa sp.]